MDPADEPKDDRQVESLVSESYWEQLYRNRTDFKSSVTLHSVLNKRLVYFQLDKLFRLFLPSGLGRRYLELGCGGSFWLPYFHRVLGYAVEGIDYSESGCQLAQAHLARFGSEGKIHLLDFRKMGSAFDGRFDVCGSFGVIEHFEQPGEQVQQFGRCLKTGGLLVTTVPWLMGFQGLLQRTFNRPVYDHHQILSLEDLVSLHTRAGLTIRHAGFLGLTTLGRNLGAGFVGRLYDGYNAVMNRLAVRIEKACRRGLPVLRGSSCIVIAQRT